MAAAPTLRFLVAHPSHFIALGFGAGLSPVAPGTVGTLVALPLAALLRAYTNDIGYLLTSFVAFVVGIWAAERTGRDLGVSDHGGIVWDEVVAFLLVLFFVGAEPLREALAFALFRFFDIVKPPPAKLIDREWHTDGPGRSLGRGGAAFYALLVFSVGQRLFA